MQIIWIHPKCMRPKQYKWCNTRWSGFATKFVQLLLMCWYLLGVMLTLFAELTCNLPCQHLKDNFNHIIFFYGFTFTYTAFSEKRLHTLIFCWTAFCLWLQSAFAVALFLTTLCNFTTFIFIQSRINVWLRFCIDDRSQTIPLDFSSTSKDF